MSTPSPPSLDKREEEESKSKNYHKKNENEEEEDEVDFHDATTEELLVHENDNDDEQDDKYEDATDVPDVVVGPDDDGDDGGGISDIITSQSVVVGQFIPGEEGVDASVCPDHVGDEVVARTSEEAATSDIVTGGDFNAQVGEGGLVSDEVATGRLSPLTVDPALGGNLDYIDDENNAEELPVSEIDGGNTDDVSTGMTAGNVLAGVGVAAAATSAVATGAVGTGGAAAGGAASAGGDGAVTTTTSAAGAVNDMDSDGALEYVSFGDSHSHEDIAGTMAGTRGMGNVSGGNHCPPDRHCGRWCGWCENPASFPILISSLIFLHVLILTLGIMSLAPLGVITSDVRAFTAGLATLIWILYCATLLVLNGYYALSNVTKRWREEERAAGRRGRQYDTSWERCIDSAEVCLDEYETRLHRLGCLCFSSKICFAGVQEHALASSMEEGYTPPPLLSGEGNRGNNNDVVGVRPEQVHEESAATAGETTPLVDDYDIDGGNEDDDDDDDDDRGDESWLYRICPPLRHFPTSWATNNRCANCATRCREVWWIGPLTVSLLLALEGGILLATVIAPCGGNGPSTDLKNGVIQDTFAVHQRNVSGIESDPVPQIATRVPRPFAKPFIFAIYLISGAFPYGKYNNRADIAMARVETYKTGCSPECTIDILMPRRGWVQTRRRRRDEDYHADGVNNNETFKPPILFHLHSGEWDSGRKSQTNTAIGYWLDRGYSFLSVDYRLPSHMPNTIITIFDQIDDVKDAWIFVKSQASSWGLDPTRAVFLGESAGGYLATMVAYRYNDDGSIRGVLNMYGPTEWKYYFDYIGNGNDKLGIAMNKMLPKTNSSDTRQNQLISASVSSYVTNATITPPTLTIHGSWDTLVPIELNEYLHYEVLSRHGINNYLLHIPLGEHAMDFGWNSVGGQLTRYATERFFAATLLGVPRNGFYNLDVEDDNASSSGAISS